MKFSENWLRSLVDLSADTATLERRFNMIGHEVESLERLGISLAPRRCDSAPRGAARRALTEVEAVTPKPLNKFFARAAKLFYICSHTDV